MPPAEEDDYKSRSQKKRESTAAQNLGTALTSLAERELRALNIPEPLIAAIADWKKFPGHEARRRQMQYIGRLMRALDTRELAEKLETHLAPSRAEAQALHTVEALREALLRCEGRELEEKLSDLTARHPKAALPRLRHLVAAAQDERAKKRPPRAYRELFRYLRDLREAS